MQPLVSIGIPVFNAETTLPATLDSLFQQTYTNYEVIICDNASQDKTAKICQAAVRRRGNVSHLRSPVNRGAFWNFQKVLGQAKGKYFMWLAADDMISKNFLECNVRPMEKKGSSTVAVAGWNFHPHPLYRKKKIGFACRGHKGQRLSSLLENIYDSHGIFYSLMRTNVIRSFPFGNGSFPAWDWAVDAHLAAHGEIQRTRGAQIVFGDGGMSLKKEGWNLFQADALDRILPTGRFTFFLTKQLGGVPLFHQIKILTQLIKLNQRVRHDLRNSRRYGQG
jgi:hypothetical protein